MSEQIQQMQRLQLAGTFAGGIAHDLNNELTLVLGNLELALDSLPVGYDAHETLESARSAAGRCADLSQRLLHLGREKRTTMAAMDVAAAVVDARQMLECIKPPHVHMTTESATGLIILGDAGKIQQVLLNLGTNAFHAMEKGGELTIRAWQEKDAVNITVQDTGCGIPASLHKRIFEPFYTTRTARGSSGLGLTTTRSIISRHGGTIRLQSKSGEGTTFHLTFPLLTPAEGYVYLASLHQKVAEKSLATDGHG